jgi:hypothetical protein
MTQGDRIETRDYGPRGERHTCRSYIAVRQEVAAQLPSRQNDDNAEYGIRGNHHA